MRLIQPSRRDTLNHKDHKTTDEQIAQSLQATNEEYLPCYFRRLLINTEKRCFFAEAMTTRNLLEMTIEMVGYFTSNPHVKYFVIHLVDRFYQAHLAKVTEEYRSLSSEERVNNSWPEILKRLRAQTPFRLATCIFIAIKYNYQVNGLKMHDYLCVLDKYDYDCTEERFLRSELRVLKEIDYDLDIVTLLDVVLYLQALLKFNIDLDTGFYFPHIYDLIDLIYSTELRANEQDHLDPIHVDCPRTFKLFASLVLCLVPLLLNHADTKKVSRVLKNGRRRSNSLNREPFEVQLEGSESSKVSKVSRV